MNLSVFSSKFVLVFSTSCLLEFSSVEYSSTSLKEYSLYFLVTFRNDSIVAEYSFSFSETCCPDQILSHFVYKTFLFFRAFSNSFHVILSTSADTIIKLLKNSFLLSISNHFATNSAKCSKELDSFAISSNFGIFIVGSDFVSFLGSNFLVAGLPLFFFGCSVCSESPLSTFVCSDCSESSLSTFVCSGCSESSLSTFVCSGCSESSLSTFVCSGCSESSLSTFVCSIFSELSTPTFLCLESFSVSTCKSSSSLYSFKFLP